MGNRTQLAVKEWDEGQIAMLTKLKRYSTQIQNMAPKDPSGRPLALANSQYLLQSGLVKPLDVLLTEQDPNLYLPISYLEGMPTIYGVPIWEQLEGEPIEYYELFRRYRTLIDDKGLRSVHKLSKESGVPVRNLELLRQAFFWQTRVSAFDVYRREEREYMLEFFRDEVQEKHRRTARELFDKCTKYILDNTQLLSPKTALDWAKLAVELERISVGLNPDKPGTIRDQGPTSVVNIQNNVGGVTEHGTAVTGNLDEDRTRLKQFIHVMNSIGIIQPKEVEEVEVIEYEPSDD